MITKSVKQVALGRFNMEDFSPVLLYDQKNLLYGIGYKVFISSIFPAIVKQAFIIIRVNNCISIPIPISNMLPVSSFQYLKNL